jgi:hypothetical protein
MINAFGSRKESSIHYLNDVIDSDGFLRAGNWILFRGSYSKKSIEQAGWAAG